MAATHDKERELTREISQQVETSVPGTEVLAVELLGPDRICVFIDHPQGVDHALCARVTGVLDPFRRTYGIDVSSPGSERPLRKPEHFRSVVGRRAAVRTAQEIGGRKRFRGEVVAADERSVRLAAGSDELIEIPYDSIVRGNLIATPESR
jgi:ribosome maturation factor RimP